jgi:hypothetical protein
MPSTWDLQFSSAPQLGVSTIKGLCSWFRLRDEEPSFKEFLASLVMMSVDLLSIKPHMGCTICYQLAILSEL